MIAWLLASVNSYKGLYQEVFGRIALFQCFFNANQCVYAINSVEFAVRGLADVLSACSRQRLVRLSSGTNDGKLVVLERREVSQSLRVC